MKKAIIIAGIVIVVMLILGAVRNSGKSEFKTYESYIIKSGDTLWSISKKYKPENVGYREYIYELRKSNGIDSNIYPGQIIKIPVSEE